MRFFPKRSQGGGRAKNNPNGRPETDDDDGIEMSTGGVHPAAVITPKRKRGLLFLLAPWSGSCSGCVWGRSVAITQPMAPPQSFHFPRRK